MNKSRTPTDPRTDFELTQASSQGDMEAFEELYLRHHRHVYSLCLRMMKNTSLAEDLTQDVFVQLYRTIKSFKGESKFTTWFHRLTVNQVLMHYRRKTTREETGTEDDSVQQLMEQQLRVTKPDDTISRIDIEKAMETLPNGYRNVFILHDVEGFSHEEVALLLGCSVGTSKSQLHKARLKLRKELKKQKPAKVFDWDSIKNYPGLSMA